MYEFQLLSEMQLAPDDEIVAAVNTGFGEVMVFTRLGYVYLVRRTN